MIKPYRLTPEERYDIKYGRELVVNFEKEIEASIRYLIKEYKKGKISDLDGEIKELVGSEAEFTFSIVKDLLKPTIASQLIQATIFRVFKKFEK